MFFTSGPTAGYALHPLASITVAAATRVTANLVGLPDSIHAGLLDPTVSTDQRQTEVDSRGGNDAVGHVWDLRSRHAFYGIGYFCRQGGQDQATGASLKFSIQLCLEVGRNASPFLQVDDLHQTDCGDVDDDLAAIAGVENTPGSRAKTGLSSRYQISPCVSVTASGTRCPPEESHPTSLAVPRQFPLR